ncbi:DNA/RNA helicase [Aquibacillus halophilus]|uniref:DNA/RNA helicase n=1 Tax=Aquibacillus halophilus TaxID=930132 RepID=A0A6A8D882_9BACI|nr:DEAD/DEAH box helicase [Aquibacillus halophilus]MRH41965.1 DNA/RNA helicase [Aquibacillus halophilus]
MNDLFTSVRSLFTPTYDWIPTSKNTNTTTDDTFSLRFSGKLLLQSEIPLEPSTFTHLVSINYLTPVIAIEKTPWGHRCRRCGVHKKRMLAFMPCAKCGKTHLYCRNCIEMGRITSCEPLYYWTGPLPSWTKQVKACQWQGELSRYQQTASEQIVTTMKRGNDELLVWAVCGAGKTEMLFDGIGKSIEEGKRVCLATPRTDVVREILPRFRSAFPDTDISGLYGGSEDKDGTGQLVISTTHQLFRFAHAFDIVIIDEIDAFPFHSDPSLIFAANRAAKPDAARIYLTATPRQKQRQRVESKKLNAVFVPVRFHGHPLPVPTLQMDFQLKSSLKKYNPPKTFFTWYKNRSNPKRQLLIFVPTIKLAEEMVETLSFSLNLTENNPIYHVHASDSNREERVQQFRDKEFSILITTTILERGVTFPSVDVVVIDAGHSVFDEAALVQIAGRAGRSPNDPTGEVIFFHEGKTNAIVQAVKSINLMNKRGGKL